MDRPVDAINSRELRGLDNVFSFGDGLVNGSAPETDEAFASLAGAGIRTIISVEGGTPDVERARAHGMRYVHIPIGYDSVPAAAGRRIVRAVHDLPKPVYIHCYHGRHRSPAAAAYVQVCLGEWSPDTATAAMRRAGASDRYPGLYESVREAQRLDRTALLQTAADFPEIAEAPDLKTAMAKIGRHWDQLDLLRDNQWQPDQAFPDLVADREAEIIADTLEVLARTRAVQTSYPEPFMARLRQASAVSAQLKDRLQADTGADPDQLFDTLDQSCTDCHRAYRN
jgi:protein tyrosine phosphatase (PTP) superfamily phosphohydrolase (DUF442 family)